MNLTVASGGTAQRRPESVSKSLRARILSALVLFPVAVSAVVYQTPWFEIMVIVAAIAMAWEWARICAIGRFELYGYLSVGITVLALAGAGVRRFDLALVVIVMGAAAVLYAARAVDMERAPWAAGGVLAVGLPIICLIWIENSTATGWLAVLWLFGAVWATDIGAYGFGSVIGGARLAPRISPGKTWAGLLGGILCAVLWSALWGIWFATPSPIVLGLVGAVCAVTAQAGDLGVSVVKRRFGVKNASGLIPGHGGVLDRADGLMTTAPALAMLLFVSEGNKASWLTP